LIPDPTLVEIDRWAALTVREREEARVKEGLPEKPLEKATKDSSR
jgi:hypothetical protein